MIWEYRFSERLGGRNSILFKFQRKKNISVTHPLYFPTVLLMILGDIAGYDYLALIINSAMGRNCLSLNFYHLDS